MGIDTYLTVVFWIGIIGLLARFLILVSYEYPRKRTATIGMDLGGFVLSIAFFVWICVLKFN